MTRAKALSIGIVGGTSPESTAHYYLHIVHRHFREYGDHSYPRILIASLNFQEMLRWQEEGNVDALAGALSRECQALAAGGADFALLAANTMHMYLPRMKSPLPMLTVYDAVADAARAAGLKRLGLTGTRLTMSEPFYREGLKERGLEVVLPSQEDQEAIHRIIFAELVRGVVTPTSALVFGDICRRLMGAGADGILLACTELGMLIAKDVPRFPCLDTAEVHAEAAWRKALGL
jgi:aspartate racemase